MNDPSLRRRVFVPITEGLVVLTASIGAVFYLHQSYLLEKVTKGLLDFSEYARALNTSLLLLIITMLIFAELMSWLSWAYLRRAERALNLTTEELRSRNEWLSSVVNATADGIIAIDEHGVITLFNPAAERMFGRMAQETIGQEVGCLMPEELREEHRQYIRTYFTTGAPSGAIDKDLEFTAIRHDGTRFPLELSLSMETPFGKRIVVAIVRDVSERKQCDEELRLAKDMAEETAARLRKLSQAFQRQCLESGTDTHFDPATVEAFLAQEEQFVADRERYAETNREAFAATAGIAATG